MLMLRPRDLKEAIDKYRNNHPRKIEANFEGEMKEYPIEQPGLDIIDSLLLRIEELEFIVEERNKKK